MGAAKANAYLRTKVMTAGPAELRLMLLDGAIRFAEHARVGLDKKDYEAVYIGVTRCQNILMELMTSLRPEHDPELCGKLNALYTFMYTRLLKASSERSAAIVEEVLDLLRYERQTWQMLIEQMQAERADAGDSSPAAGATHPDRGELTDPSGRAGGDDRAIGRFVSVKG